MRHINLAGFGQILLQFFVWSLFKPVKDNSESEMIGGQEDRKMDPAQLVIPVFSIAAAAAFTFYAVSFSEIRTLESLEQDHDRNLIRGIMCIVLMGHKTRSIPTVMGSLWDVPLRKSFEDLESSETEKPKLKSSLSSKERRAIKKSVKEQKK